MRFGFTLPNNWGLDDPRSVVDLGVRAEAAGYDSVWVNHHVLNVGYVGQRLGSRPYYDALTILTWVAARTERVGLGTSVLVVPYLHPLSLAKALATLDQLSGGRVVAGLGVGSLQEEHEALGLVPFADRGRYTDEAIEVMRALWRDDEPSYAGQHFAFGPVVASPGPHADGGVPIVIGGNKRPALRRVARLGDGWHPLGLAPASVATRLVTLDEELAAVGRTRDGLLVQVRLEVDLDAAVGRSPLYGPPEHLRGVVEAYAAVGVGELVISLGSADLDRQVATLERFATEVMGASR